MKSIWALIISASLMVACDEDDPSPQGIFDFGTEFQLQFDATVFSADSVLSVSFKEIIEDSRCPGDATCVWAGIGVISLEVKEMAGNCMGLDFLIKLFGMQLKISI